MHILKLNLAPLEAQGPCSGEVLHLGECHPVRAATIGLVFPRHREHHADSRFPQPPTRHASLTSGFSFSRSNMFSMSMKFVWIILQEQCWLGLL